MNTNNDFKLIVRAMPRIYLDISNTFDHSKNVVKINGINYTLSSSQFTNLKSLIEDNFSHLADISNIQTESYITENGIDGYAKNITILINNTSIYVDFAVTDTLIREYGNTLINTITKLFLE